MNSTPNPQAIAPADDLIARADERLARAYEQIADADEQLARVNEQLLKLDHDAAPPPSAVLGRLPSRGRPMLRGLIGQGILRILFQKCLERVLGLARLRAVAVRLFHLAIMRHRHLQLSVSGFRQHGEEDSEIHVRLNRLGGVCGPAFLVIRIRNRQLCFGQVLAVRVGIDQRLQVQPAHFMPAMLDVIHCLFAGSDIRYHCQGTIIFTICKQG